MRVLILAAGYATRLYPLTKEYPKPLLEVKGRPIIDYILDKIYSVKEIDEIVVITNSKFISKFRKWRNTLRSARRIVLVDDLTKGLNDRRGAIGDMNFAITKRRIRDDLLVIGGDNLFNYDLNRFFSFAKKAGGNPVIGVYDIKDKAEAKKYGIVRLDKKRRLVDFEEKPSRPKSTLAAMCLYYFPKDKLRLLKEYITIHKQGQDATGFYIDWLRKETPVYGFVFGGNWYDIGDFKFYNKAKSGFKQ